MTDLLDKYIGSFIGSANGDSLGIAVETWPKARIQRHYGRITGHVKQKLIYNNNGEILKFDDFGDIKYWGRNIELGEVTDDNILAFPLAESLIECDSFNLVDVTNRRIEAYLNRVREMQERGAKSNNGGFGGTTVKAFNRVISGCSPLESGVQGCGNGPSMAIFPLGLYMHKKQEYESGLEFAVQIGRTTHLDPRSVAAGVIQTHLVYSLLDNIPKSEIIDSAIDICERYEGELTKECTGYECGTLVNRLKWVKKNNHVSEKKVVENIGNGGAVFESYPFTLFMFQKYYNDPIEGLIEIINRGGDSDTNGAMFGSLAGALYGDIFPDEWNTILKDLEKIKNLGEGLFNLK